MTDFSFTLAGPHGLGRPAVHFLNFGHPEVLSPETFLKIFGMDVKIPDERGRSANSLRRPSYDQLNAHLLDA
jgi:hypothetical protein